VLNLSNARLDVGEGFFDLGGNSLLTIPLLKEVTAAFDGRKVVLDDIFAYPSIAELAAYLRYDTTCYMWIPVQAAWGGRNGR